MLRSLTLALLMSGMILAADDPKAIKLTAPPDWPGETIELPPGFARDMKLKGSEHIRFAPGMFKADSDAFFSYALLFELQTKPELTEEVIQEELLKYYRGLCKAVLNGKLPDVDPSKFTLELAADKSNPKQSDDKSAEKPTLYTGTLDWLEPFVTRKPQKLNLEIRLWSGSDHNYIFLCVSPQPSDAAIWKQLHTIRDEYLKRKTQ